MFKKRSLNKSNLRERGTGHTARADGSDAPGTGPEGEAGEGNTSNSREHEGEEEDAGREGETVAQRLARVKEEQHERKRLAGLEVTLSSSAASGHAAGEQAAQKRSIGDVMGGQYRVGSHQELSGSTTAHSDIMEAYIAERLGSSTSASGGTQQQESEKSIFQRLDDELYKVPDHIKQLAGPSKSSREAEIVSAGMGLAEVILPSEYHRKNIEATEAARRQILKDKKDKRLEGGSGNGGLAAPSRPVAVTVMKTHGDQVVSNFRYQQQGAAAAAARYHASSEAPQEATVPLPGEEIPGQQQHQQGHGQHQQHQGEHKRPRFGYSTDQAAVQRFKQRSYK